MSLWFAAGTVVDERYELIERIGEGGMGTIYKATEIELQRVVALKILHATLIGNDESIARFMREGKALASLSHPNLLKFYRFGVWSNSWPYIATEWIDSQSLQKLVTDREHLSIQDSIQVAIQVCKGMQAAHHAGIIHRDLSPNNIMVNQADLSQVKVIDFGLALLVSATNSSADKLTGTGMLLGSVHYMSPEQCAGSRVDERSDIYSLGCVVYHMITGSPPFSADNAIAMMKHHRDERPKPLKESLPRADIPAGIERCLLHAMSKSPETRYQSMEQFAIDLASVAAGQGDHIAAPEQLTKSPRRPHRLVIAMLVPMTVMAALLWMHEHTTRLQERIDFETQSRRAARAPSLTIQRRLRADNVCELYSEQQLEKYYREWLLTYGNDLNLDSCQARAKLAKLYDKEGTEAVESSKLKARAYRDGLQLLDQQIKAGDTNNAALTTSILAELVNSEDQSEQGLLRIIDKLGKNPNEPFYDAVNRARSWLSALYMRQKKYALALNQIDKALATSGNYSQPPAQRLEWQVRRASCLGSLNRKAEARKQNAEALEYAVNEVEFGEAQKLDLLSSYEQLKDFASELSACNSLEAWIKEKEMHSDFGAAFYVHKATALEGLSRSLEAYELLDSKFDSASASARAAYWPNLCILDSRRQLHKEHELSQRLKQLLHDAADKMHLDWVRQICVTIRDAAERRLDDHKTETANAIDQIALDNFNELMRYRDDQICTYFAQIGWQLCRLSRIDEADRITKQVMKSAEKEPAMKAETLSTIYCTQAGICKAQGDITKGLEFCDRAVGLFQGEQQAYYAPHLVQAIWSRCALLNLCERHKEALDAAMRALQISQEYDFADGIITSHDTIAICLTRLHRLSQAEQHWSTGIELALKAQNIRLAADLMMSLAMGYLAEHQLDKFENTIERALKTAHDQPLCERRILLQSRDLCQQAKCTRLIKEIAKRETTLKKLQVGLKHLAPPGPKQP